MKLSLSALRAICAAATPCPWREWASHGWPDSAKVIIGEELVTGVWWPLRLTNETQDDRPLVWCRKTTDQAFIAAAREALPALIDEVSRLRAALKDACDEFEGALAYKSDYLIEKHGDRETLARLRGAIEKAGSRE